MNETQAPIYKLHLIEINEFCFLNVTPYIKLNIKYTAKQEFFPLENYDIKSLLPSLNNEKLPSFSKGGKICGSH